MNRRVVTKIGDVFAVQINDKARVYFQLIAYDIVQLNSDVVRVFTQKYSTHESPRMSDIVRGEVHFYAHCVTRAGIKFGYWEKVGKADDIGESRHILFRGTSDYGRKPGMDAVKVSNNWYVWRLGDESFTHVGRLQGENRQAEIGLVFEPESIVHRMKTGEYLWSYPSFD